MPSRGNPVINYDQRTYSGALAVVMQSPFTWLALMVFIGLTALMLQRSVAEAPVDRLWHYAPPAIGCAAVDILGTHRHAPIAIIILLAVVTYIIYVLRPARR